MMPTEVADPLPPILPGQEPWLVLRPGENEGSWTAATLLEAGRTAQRSGGPVRIECGDVDFLDTGLLQVVIALRRAQAAQGRPLVVTGVSESAARYLQLAGLTEAVLGSRGQGEEER